LDYPPRRLAFEELKRRLLEAQARSTGSMRRYFEAVEGWRFAPVVPGLQALRGVRLVVAATLAKTRRSFRSRMTTIPLGEQCVPRMHRMLCRVASYVFQNRRTAT